MDYKFVEDLSILSRESIINEYNVLYGLYNELRVTDQRQLQEIHQLKRGTRLTDKICVYFDKITLVTKAIDRYEVEGVADVSRNYFLNFYLFFFRFQNFKLPQTINNIFHPNWK